MSGSGFSLVYGKQEDFFEKTKCRLSLKRCQEIAMFEGVKRVECKDKMEITEKGHLILFP